MGFFLWGWVSAAASVLLSWRPVRCSCGPTELGYSRPPPGFKLNMSLGLLKQLAVMEALACTRSGSISGIWS
uniref:Putative secreted protein n=1 Tax=Ixodes scapularis TaxID=6945 RepID=A0A4D5S4V8_IXOSC